VAWFGVPELTWSAIIKLNMGLYLRRFPDALSIGTGQFPQASGPTAKPSGDHIPLGGFVFYFECHAPNLDEGELFRGDCRRYDWMVVAHRLDSAPANLVSSQSSPVWAAAVA